MVTSLTLGGCEALTDQGAYLNSEFKRVHITELSKGYVIDGSGEFNGKFGYLYLYFCKNNRYKYALSVGNVYEGDYTIYAKKGTVTLIGDDTDSEGKPIQGTFSTDNGYILQKKQLHAIGNNLDFHIQDIHNINSSDCTQIREDIL